MKTVLKSAILVAAVMVAGCTSSVGIDFDPEYDFSGYRTYRWYEVEPHPGDTLAANPLARRRVFKAVDRALAEKGFRLVDGQESDFLVFAHGMVRDRIHVHDTGGFYLFPGPFAFGGYTDVTRYEETTLFVDVIDPTTRQLIWRGSRTDVVKSYKDPEKAQAATDKAVRRILKDFPPGWD